MNMIPLSARRFGSTSPRSSRPKPATNGSRFLTKLDICVGKMLTLDEVPNDPQVLARKMIVEVDTPEGGKVKQVGISVKLSDTPGTIRSLAPKLGQHTDEILARAGLRAGANRTLARGRINQVATVFCSACRFCHPDASEA